MSLLMSLCVLPLIVTSLYVIVTSLYLCACARPSLLINHVNISICCVRQRADLFCERLTFPKRPTSIGRVQDATPSGIEQTKRDSEGHQRDSEKSVLAQQIIPPAGFRKSILALEKAKQVSRQIFQKANHRRASPRSRRTARRPVIETMFPLCRQPGDGCRGTCFRLQTSGVRYRLGRRRRRTAPK